MRYAVFSLLVVAAAAAAQSPREAGLPATEWRAMNVFFSNFAEAGVEPFRRGAVSDEALARFGVLHTRINAPQRVERGRGTDERVAARHVEAAALKYFGVSLARHRSFGLGGDRVAFANGHYVFPGADGEVHPFAHVARWEDAGGGEFAADVSVYQGEDVDGDVYGTSVAALRRGGMDVRLLHEMRARVRRVREGGRSRYVLLDWLPAR